MAETKKKNLLPRLEMLIILVFFVSFIGWGLNKCNRSKIDLQAQNEDLSEEGDTSSVDSIQTAALSTPPVQNPIPSNIANEEPKSYLYVIIDGLKMRVDPNLRGEVIHEFKLYDRVEFMEEVTDSTTQLKLSKDITANEPWVKVRNRKGKTGWVYGAGVHYHKQKYPGLD